MDSKKYLLIESHYLPSIEYMALLSRYDHVVTELEENFQKQSYRNRCHILGANKTLKLVVPVQKKEDRRMSVTEISYKQEWIKDHVRALQSAYNRSPYFLYYKDELFDILNKRPRFLAELNRDILTFCLKKLQYNISVDFTTSYVKKVDTDQCDDFRGILDAKASYHVRDIITAKPYFQMFGKTFVPNLSILDLLFCEGPASREIISASLNN